MGVLSRFRIPTIIGVGIILAGIFAGVVLVLNQQNFFSQASIEAEISNLTISNITPSSVSISFVTNLPVPSHINFGEKTPKQHTVLDINDQKLPQERSVHYFNLSNLSPNTSYQFVITSGNKTSQIERFKTAIQNGEPNGFAPAIGTMVFDDQAQLEGIAYLAISGANILSAPIKNNGNYLIPLIYMQEEDLNNPFFPTAGLEGKITLITPQGKADALIQLSMSSNTVPPLRIGDKKDFSEPSPTPIPTPTVIDLKIFDLNDDGIINTADNAVVLNNLGKNPKNKRADLNNDSKVDEVDLEIMSTKINQLISP